MHVSEGRERLLQRRARADLLGGEGAEEGLRQLRIRGDDCRMKGRADEGSGPRLSELVAAGEEQSDIGFHVVSVRRPYTLG